MYSTPPRRSAVVGRSPEPAELQLLVNRVRSYIDDFDNRPDDAEKLLAIGQKPRDKSLDPAVHAAYTTIMNTLLNLDELLVKP